MTIAARLPEATHAGAQDSRAYNLLLTSGELARVFEDAVRSGSRLNAFLAAAAMSQIADDFAHRDRARLVETAEFLDACGRSGLARLPSTLARAAQTLQARGRGSGALDSYRRALDRTVATAADALVSGEEVELQLPAIPGELDTEVLRLPACFHAFDQRPEDVERLAAEFGRRHREQRSPVLVVGVRTSGSYLAPLFAAFLRRNGHADVAVLGVRPGHPLSASERTEVRRRARAGAWMVVIDDAPVTGRSLLSAAAGLERLGAARESIVVAAQLFRGQALPERLRAYESVILEAGEWEIERRLAAPSVAGDLGYLLGAGGEHVEAVPLTEDSGRRGHHRRLFRVRFNGAEEAMVLAEGVGLGFFGEQALAACERLSERLPLVYGLRDGVLYREWLDERRPADADLGPAVAAYVVARRDSLPVARDPSRGLVGRSPAWEVVSSILSRAFLRAWPLARAAFLDRVTQVLLEPSRPSVVDGRTSRSEWFTSSRPPYEIVKAPSPDRSFWRLGLTNFDAVFDLAGLDPGAPDEELAREARGSYERLTGEEVDEERWLLYQLAHLWGRGRTHPEEEPALRRASSRALQRYFAAALLADTAPPDGPVCAVDLDGVLETEALGMPATSAVGALALRALARHGFRTVIVTGRSASDVVERCGTYRLAGGVAEYGSFAYDAATGEGRVLSPPNSQQAEEIRRRLARLPGIEFDADYRHCVRAFTCSGGRRRGLAEEAIAQASRIPGVRAVRGEAQTDFVVGETDKGGGVLALLEMLGETRLALAVGDTASDLPMLGLAECAVAPANADAEVRRSGVTIAGRGYQAGFADAVATLLGHEPGACAVCAAPDLAPRTRLLLDILSVQERGARGVVANLLRLAWRTRVG